MTGIMTSPALPVVIDPMQLADIPYVMRIEHRAFSMSWTSGIYQRELAANPWSHYFVLRPCQPHLPPILAYGGVWQIDTSAHIPTIATHPRYQSRGLGGYLLSHLLLAGAHLGCHEATLEVRVSNMSAQHLYQHLGFITVGKRPHYYNDNLEDALIMTLAPLDEAEIQAELRDRAQRLVHITLPPLSDRS